MDYVKLATGHCVSGVLKCLIIERESNFEETWFKFGAESCQSRGISSMEYIMCKSMEKVYVYIVWNEKLLKWKIN